MVIIVVIIIIMESLLKAGTRLFICTCNRVFLRGCIGTDPSTFSTVAH